MRVGEIHLSAAAANALDALAAFGDVGRINLDLEKMAWIWLVLRGLEDSERVFPCGKWATIQHIGQQLERSAAAKAAEINASEENSDER